MTTSVARSSKRDPARWNMTPVPARVAERAFLRREAAERGCWISAYSVGSHGYAQIGWKDDSGAHMVLAHRASWVHVKGQVPVGMTLDHTCKVRPCVNPSHLRLLSNYENSRRNSGGDWAFGTCRNGHPDSNLREVPRTAKSGRKYMGLQCATCMKESQLRWLQANPDKRAATLARGYAKSKARKHALHLANTADSTSDGKVVAKEKTKIPKRRKGEPMEIQVEYF